ncbi:ABC-three component system protein [Pseudomonas syringae]|uniref:ABC-three component system protein n=1 Tax=Pseudomonas syringae TaxID=317 RepID=UPI00073F8DDB|nr:ABC-three component system protein [Pseudomonas syringae]
MAFDASPSWSGFNYQGKVALYYALTLINAQPIEFDFSKTNLMLEANEDFEVIVDGLPISFHQVKAYNSSTFEDYSDALFGLTIELYKRPKVNGYIHTWKKINDRPNCESILESVKNDFTSVINEYQGAEPKTGDTLLEKAASDETKVKKKAAILKAALPGKSAEELATIINEIITIENDALKRLTCYTYEDKNAFCDLKDINIKIKRQLSFALNARKIPITDEQLEKAFEYFLGMIDKYIIDRHKTKTTIETKPITFMEIINSLNFDHEDVSKHYMACRFKDRFSRLIDEYLGDIEDYPQPSLSEPCNLKAAQQLLLSLPPHELWEHYRHFSPQIILSYDNNTDNALSCNDEGIRLCLLKILHGISFSYSYQGTNRFRFSYKCSNTPPQSYLPTTITGIGKISQIVSQINANPCLSELLYEINNLIYSGNIVHPFSPDWGKHTDAPPSKESEARVKQIDILPTITLIPLEIAKDALDK